MSWCPLQLPFPAEGPRSRVWLCMGSAMSGGQRPWERRKREENGGRGGEEDKKGGEGAAAWRSAWLGGRGLLPQDPTTFQWGLRSSFTLGLEPSSWTLVFHRKQQRNLSKPSVLPGLAMGLPGKAEEERRHFWPPAYLPLSFPFDLADEFQRC